MSDEAAFGQESVRLLNHVTRVQLALQPRVQLKPGEQAQIGAIVLQRARSRVAFCHSAPLLTKTIKPRGSGARERAFPNQQAICHSERSEESSQYAVGDP